MSQKSQNLDRDVPLLTSDILLIKIFYLCVIKSLNSKGYNHFNN